MEIAKMIAANHRGAVMGIKKLMLEQMAAVSRAAVRCGARVHDARAARRASEGGLSRIHRAEGAQQRLSMRNLMRHACVAKKK